MKGTSFMSGKEILGRAAELSARGEPYALATVVARQPPSSSRVGQKALISADGHLSGWLGGSCIEPVVRKEAGAALRDGLPRLVVLAPDAAHQRPDAVVYPMTCHSGGTVEIYIEPQLPGPVLALFGDSPICRALAAIGVHAGFAVESIPGPSEGVSDVAGRDLYAIVATMGEWDEDAVECALSAEARYVGLVASPRRAAEIRRTLGRSTREWSSGRLDAISSPAGLDIGAREPGEIAISILAELIERRRAASDEPQSVASTSSPASEPAAPRDAEGIAIDPICGMEVEIAGARHTLEHGGEVWYFCCAGCRAKHEREIALTLES